MSKARFLDFDRDPVGMAHRLLGQRLVRIVGGERLAGTIVEVEAYLGAKDRAAHTYGGRRTARNASMYLPGGHAYVYMIYGLHYCLNVVCGAEDEGVAVLLRALEPTEGLDIMRANRGFPPNDLALCAGPARLTQALQIHRTQDGVDLRTSDELFIERVRSRRLPARLINRGPRVGVEYAAEWALSPLRFWIASSRFISPARSAVRDRPDRVKNS